MKILRLAAGILAGLVAVTAITESIEFVTVKLLSGRSMEYLAQNQDEYFAVRNRTGVLMFKQLYNFFAAVAGGYLMTLIASAYRKIGLYALVALQSLALVWGGFFSEFSTTGPAWIWMALIVLTPVGFLLGYRLRANRVLLEGDPKDTLAQ